MVDTARLRKRRDSGNGATQKATARSAWPARPKSALSRFSRPRWRRRDFPDRGRDGATNNHFYRDRSGSGATFAFRAETVRTTVHTARLSRPRRRRRDFPDQGGKGAIFQTKAETTRLSRSKRRQRDPSDQDGDGAIFQTEAETARPRLFSSRLSKTRKNFPDYRGDGATLQTKTDTARLSRPRRKRRDFSDQSGDGATFQNEAETAKLEKIICGRGGRGATLPIRLETAQTTVHMARDSKRTTNKREILKR